MARLRDAVICEWTETVNNPQAQVRFKHFITATKRDPNVQVVAEREQHRPRQRHMNASRSKWWRKPYEPVEHYLQN